MTKNKKTYPTGGIWCGHAISPILARMSDDHLSIHLSTNGFHKLNKTITFKDELLAYQFYTSLSVR